MLKVLWFPGFAVNYADHTDPLSSSLFKASDVPGLLPNPSVHIITISLRLFNCQRGLKGEVSHLWLNPEAELWQKEPASGLWTDGLAEL